MRRSKRWYRLKLKHGQEASGKEKANSDAVANASGTAVADEEEEPAKKKKQPAKKGITKKRKGVDQADDDGSEAGQKRVKAEKVEGDDGVWQRLLLDLSLFTDTPVRRIYRSSFDGRRGKPRRS